VLHRVSGRLIARCQETLSRRGSAERRQRQQALADGLVFFDGRLHLADRDPDLLGREPERLMKVFWHLHRLGCELSLELEGAAQVFNEVEKPELLMLGMLLHDIGKAKGHGHVAKGISLARALTARLALPSADAAVVEFLVAHHVTMSHVAQRRDLDDPKTIVDFAATVEDPQRLRMLYLLTYADMRAVGPGLLTPWQARVLHDLYTRTNAQLTAGRVERPSRPQIAERLRLAVGEEQAVEVGKDHLEMMVDRSIASTDDRWQAEH